MQELSPRVLVFSPAARGAWIRFADEIKRELGTKGALRTVAAFANKAAEHAARIAAVLAIVDDLDSAEIDLPTLERAIELVRHYLAEALRLAATTKVDPDLELAKSALEWLHGKWDEPLISLPDMYQLGPPVIRSRVKANRAFSVLVQHSWLIPLEKGGVIKGKPSRDVWQVVRPVVR